jgi:hypothetical protein
MGSTRNVQSATGRESLQLDGRVCNHRVGRESLQPENASRKPDFGADTRLWLQTLPSHLSGSCRDDCLLAGSSQKTRYRKTDRAIEIDRATEIDRAIEIDRAKEIDRAIEIDRAYG